MPEVRRMIALAPEVTILILKVIRHVQEIIAHVLEVIAHMSEVIALPEIIGFL